MSDERPRMRKMDPGGDDPDSVEVELDEDEETLDEAAGPVLSEGAALREAAWQVLLLPLAEQRVRRESEQQRLDVTENEMTEAVDAARPAALRETAARLAPLPKSERELRLKVERERLGVPAAAMKAAIKEAEAVAKAAEAEQEAREGKAKATTNPNFDIVDAPAETLDEAVERLATLEGAEYLASFAEVRTCFKVKSAALERLVQRKRERPAPSPRAGGVTLPRRFRLDETGLWFLPLPSNNNPDPAPIFVSGLIKVLADTADETSNAHGLLLEWNDTRGCRHQWAMPRRLIHSEGNAIAGELEDKGLHCGTSREAHERLREFLGAVRIDRHMRCVNRAGWHDPAYVLSNGRVFGDDELVMQSERVTNSGRANAASGTLDEWRHGVAQFAIGNDRLTLLISAAFAPPLLKIVNAPSGGIHIQGESQIGKTTLQQAAASVWGPAVQDAQVCSWHATANGLEGIAAERCDGLLVLDETSQAEPSDIIAVIYMLANQQGKARANREGAAVRRATWRLLFISSGEGTIATKVAEIRRRLPAGAEVRLLNIPADAKAGMGVWQNLHGYPSGAALTDHLRRATTTYHGTAAPAFLEELVKLRRRDPDRLAAKLRTTIDDFVQKVLPPRASGQARSAAVRFGLIGAAGELAAGFGILPWEKRVALDAAAACFRHWLEKRGGATAAEHMAVLRVLRGFLGAHGSGRFGPVDKPPADPWGNRPELPRISNQAGYFKRAGDDVTEFWILPEVWRDEICAGHGLEPVTAVEVLMERSFLLAATDKHPADKQRVWGRPNPVRIYRVSSAILEEISE